MLRKRIKKFHKAREQTQNPSDDMRMLLRRRFADDVQKLFEPLDRDLTRWAYWLATAGHPSTNNAYDN